MPEVSEELVWSTVGHVYYLQNQNDLYKHLKNQKSDYIKQSHAVVIRWKSTKFARMKKEGGMNRVSLSCQGWFLRFHLGLGAALTALVKLCSSLLLKKKTYQYF